MGGIKPAAGTRLGSARHESLQAEREQPEPDVEQSQSRCDQRQEVEAHGGQQQPADDDAAGQTVDGQQDEQDSDERAATAALPATMAVSVSTVAAGIPR